jgi:hypothetical protein
VYSLGLREMLQAGCDRTISCHAVTKEYGWFPSLLKSSLQDMLIIRHQIMMKGSIKKLQVCLFAKIIVKQYRTLSLFNAQ